MVNGYTNIDIVRRKQQLNIIKTKKWGWAFRFQIKSALTLLQP